MFVLCGSSLAAATAAVLAYRVLRLGVPAVLGALANIDLRRTIRTGRRRPRSPSDTPTSRAWVTPLFATHIVNAYQRYATVNVLKA